MITTILLVDDHHGFRQFLRQLLDKETDMKVVGEAHDGRTAIRLTRELEPDVVLMDVVMEGVNGIEATTEILASHPKIRVIAISMHADKEYVEAMVGAGAVGYVLKDKAHSELVDGIRAVVAGDTCLGAGLS